MFYLCTIYARVSGVLMYICNNNNFNIIIITDYNYFETEIICYINHYHVSRQCFARKNNDVRPASQL